MKYYSEETVKKLIGYAEYNGTFGIHESLNIEKYPSIELPDKYGDLIDKNFLKQHLETCETNGRPLHCMELQERLDCIDEVPVVLEASSERCK